MVSNLCKYLQHFIIESTTYYEDGQCIIITSRVLEFIMKS